MIAFYVVLGILGGLCIATAAVGGESNIEVAGHTFTLPRRLSSLERGGLFAVGVVFLIAAIVLPSVKFGGKSSAQAGSPNRNSPSGQVAKVKTSTTAPVGPVYLSQLTPSGGDVPMRGDTQVGGQDFPNSIFYGDIGGGKQSQAQACQSPPNEDCVATQYDISNEPNRQLAAVLAVTNTSPSSNENASAPWSITVDGIVVKSGTFESNSPPEQINAPLNGGHVLQLFVNPTDPGLSETVKVVWGSAKLS